MRTIPGPRLPPLSLLRAYGEPGLLSMEELACLPGLGPRFQAVLDARGDFLVEAFLDHASEGDFQSALVRFHEQCVSPPLHTERLRRRIGIVRHALGHLLRCRDSLARKAERCLEAGGPYHVAGLGPVFWSALFQAIDPLRHPGWTPSIEAGLERLGFLSRRRRESLGQRYAAIIAAHDQLRASFRHVLRSEEEPPVKGELTALHLDHFLHLVAGMQGRNLWPGSRRPNAASASRDLAAVIHQERLRQPLRGRLKEWGEVVYQARQELEDGLAKRDGTRLRAALAAVEPVSAECRSLDWSGQSDALVLWTGRLWTAEDPYPILDAFWRADPIPGAGLWLPAAVLHLRDPQRFGLWNEAARKAYAGLDDAVEPGGSPAERYQLFNEGMAQLIAQHRLHSLELPGVLAALAEVADPPSEHCSESGPFGGFCADTFRFLLELSRNNCRDWMNSNRERYRFAVREPLVELCRILAGRYVNPVLAGMHNLNLETAARSDGALTSICRNDYGRSVPYHTALWIAFYRQGRGKRTDVQFFVRLDRTGISYGLRLGREAREAGATVRRNVHQHAGLLYRALLDSGALEECRFGEADHPASASVLSSADDLRTWAAGKTLLAFKTVAADAPLATSEDLPGDIVLTFDRLLPAYLCAVEEDPLPGLLRRTGAVEGGERYTQADFLRATFLGEDWLSRARSLLDLKRQLILQGVPGTGKTHVARCLARLLSKGREDTVRLVQFHPAYSYEEFVEGIKARSVEVEGRHDVTYPVEDGLLCSLAAEADRNPAEPYVLIIDEINRGNLPRVFGELLYLLEYRDQAVGLPYSRRSFRLPANLYVLGTMNAADRSVALVDQALRRRFSFLEMPPHAAVLSSWLKVHPPAAGPAFADRVVALFERLNARLRADLGLSCQVGHSYFMVPDLDEGRLEVVWEHHVQPLLEEYFAGQPGRAATYDLHNLLQGKQHRPGGRKRQPAGV